MKNSNHSQPNADTRRETERDHSVDERRRELVVDETIHIERKTRDRSGGRNRRGVSGNQWRDAGSSRLHDERGEKS